MNRSILVTGVSGSGKSAVCEELNNSGNVAFDIERIPGLFKNIHRDTGKVVEYFGGSDLNLAKQHDWICDKGKLISLINENSNGIVYYCGVATNLDEIIPMFDKVFLLVAGEKETRERLTHRTSNNYGRTPEVQDWIFTWKERLEKHIIDQGAEVIDANQDLRKVVDDIIKKSTISLEC